MKKFISKPENQAALCFLFLAVAMAVPVIAHWKNEAEYISMGCIFVLPFLTVAIAMFYCGKD